MQELEALMMLYLSDHWHSLDLVQEANAHALKPGLGSFPPSDVPSSVSLPTLDSQVQESSGGLHEEQIASGDSTGLRDLTAADEEDLRHGVQSCPLRVTHANLCPMCVSLKFEPDNRHRVWKVIVIPDDLLRW